MVMENWYVKTAIGSEHIAIVGHTIKLSAQRTVLTVPAHAAGKSTLKTIFMISPKPTNISKAPQNIPAPIFTFFKF